MGTRKLILVELKDGTVCRMAPKALNMFLIRDEVVQFKRAGGWAVVGRDPLRDKSRDGISRWEGIEKRSDFPPDIRTNAAIEKINLVREMVSEKI